MTRGALGVPAETKVIYVCADDHVTAVGDAWYSATLDVNGANLAAWRDLANAASCDLAVCLGDNANDSEAMVTSVGNIIATLNHKACVIGNHDMGYIAGPWGSRLTSVLTAYGMPGAYYGLDVGAWRVLVLNTCYAADDTPVADITGRIPAAEFAWLAGELATTKTGVLIFMHMPPRVTLSGDANVWFDADDLAQLTTMLNNRQNVFVFGGHWAVTATRHFALLTVPCDFLVDMSTSKRHYVLTCSTYADGQATVNVLEKVLS